MNSTQQKIVKSSKLISRILFIGNALNCIFILLSAIVICIFILGNEDLISSLQNVYKTTADGTIKIPAKEDLIILFSFAIAQLGILFTILRILYQIFKDISTACTPFEKKQVGRIKRTAQLTLVMCIASSIFDAIGHLILYDTVSIFRINVIWFALALIIFYLAHIFEYGCALQEQSDETL